MSTLNEITYDLLSVLRDGGLNIKDDEGVTLRQIAFWVRGARASLIRQQLSKRQSISDNIVQTLSCLDVSQIDASTCCDFTTDCYIVRTNSRIPQVIESNQVDLITKVGPMHVSERGYTLIPYARAPFWGSSMFNKDRPAAFLHDGYVYIMNSDFIDKISVQGVFEDPTELATFNNCDSVPCYTKDSRYPVSAHMIDTMKKMIIDTNFRVMLQANVDKTNNAESSVTPQAVNGQ